MANNHNNNHNNDHNNDNNNDIDSDEENTSYNEDIFINYSKQFNYDSDGGGINGDSDDDMLSKNVRESLKVKTKSQSNKKN